MQATALTSVLAPISPISSIAFCIVVTACTGGKIILLGRSRLVTSGLKFWTYCDPVSETTTISTTFHTSDFLYIHFCSRIQRCQERRDILIRFDQQSFEIQEDRLILILVDKGRSYTCTATSTSSANAMHIVLDLLGHVKIDHMLNGRKIQTLRCNICPN